MWPPCPLWGGRQSGRRWPWKTSWSYSSHVEGTPRRATWATPGNTGPCRTPIDHAGPCRTPIDHAGPHGKSGPSREAEGANLSRTACGLHREAARQAQAAGPSSVRRAGAKGCPGCPAPPLGGGGGLAGDSVRVREPGAPRGGRGALPGLHVEVALRRALHLPRAWPAWEGRCPGQPSPSARGPGRQASWARGSRPAHGRKVPRPGFRETPPGCPGPAGTPRGGGGVSVCIAVPAALPPVG